MATKTVKRDKDAVAMDSAAEHYQCTAYELNGITYLPHYRNHNVFVGPGYPKISKTRYSADQLEAMKAVPTALMLWSRGSSGEVSDKNP